MSKSNKEDLELIKNKLYLNRLNDQSLLTKIRSKNPVENDVQIIGNTGATYYGSSSGAFNFGRLLYCIINNVGSGTEAYSIYG